MADDTKRLGYGGSAEIDGEQVLITSGGFNSATSISYLQMLDLQPVTDSRSKVKHADGATAYSGELSLDVTDSFLNILTTSRILSRGYMFKVGIDDGEDGQELDNCLITSLSLQGTFGGLVTCSISFVSAEAPTSSASVANAFIGDAEPLGYWYSGNTDVREWSFSMNQDVQPVYTNENTPIPRYLKIGLFDFNLGVTTYEQVINTSVINIATRTFTLTGDSASEGFQFAGVTDLGLYTNAFETAASISVGSGGTIIT